MNESKLMFLFSQSPRSGHNFVADVIRLLFECSSIIGDRSEIPFGSIVESYDRILNKSYKSEGSTEFLNSVFITPIREEILKDDISKFIKYTAFSGVKETVKYFPNDIHIVSYRDPKDCLFSLFKGMRLKKGWKSTIKKTLWLTGIYHYLYSRKYSNSIIGYLPISEDLILIRYEHLVTRDNKHLEYLIETFGSTMTTTEFAKAIDSIKVINTSFFQEETKSTGIWDPSEVTESFNPINRSHSVNKLQLWGVLNGSKPLRRAMGYV